jgi:succinate dehydrogenase hydrophobic anchor subunit
MVNNLLKILNRGFLHWFTQRTSACILIVSLIAISVFDSLLFGFIGILIVLVHFEAGIHTLFSDYMHDVKSKLISNVSIDLLIISLTKTVFLFLICV